jgi:hypothetical protein
MVEALGLIPSIARKKLHTLTHTYLHLDTVNAVTKATRQPQMTPMTVPREGLGV